MRAECQVELERENAELRAKLEEAQETLLAIRNGEVDALVVAGENGDQIYTLQGADRSFRVLMETMSEGAATLGTDGTILYCNSQFARLLKASLESLIGHSLSAFLPPSQKSVLRFLIEHCKEASTRRELVFTCKDHSTITVLVAVSALDQEGMEEISLVATDLTERKEAEEQLRRAHNELELRVRERTSELRESNASLKDEIAERKRAEEALAGVKTELERQNQELEKRVSERTAKLQEAVGELLHFSYTITHDMRAPLRAMQSYGDLLVAERALSEKGKMYVTRISNSAERMDKLITDALDYAKLSEKAFEMRVVDVGTLLRGMLESYTQFQLPGVRISLVGTFPLVLANEAGLTQCFSNLLNNAIKFVQPGKTPEIKIWAEVRSAAVRFWVEDNGIGIPSQYREKVFAIFQRLHPNYEGTGIGLALVQKAAQRMDGLVGFESEPDKGSRFWLEFKKAA